MLLKNKFFVALAGTIIAYSVFISFTSYKIITSNQEEIKTIATNAENKYLHQSALHYSFDVSNSLNRKMIEIKNISKRYVELIKNIRSIKSRDILDTAVQELKKYSTNVTISDVKIRYTTDETHVTQQYKINESTYLIFQTDVTELLNKLKNKDYYSDFVTIIVDKNMNVVTDNSDSKQYLSLYKQKLKDITKLDEISYDLMIAMRKIEKKETWDSEIKINGEDHIIAIQPVKDLPWSIVTLIKKKLSINYDQDLTNKIDNNYILFSNKLFNTIIFITLFTLITSILITYYVKGPLILFSEWIKEIQRGNYEYNNPLLYRKDELGTLARNVSLMAQDISILVNNLESKITERTKLLQQSKEQAEKANINKSKFIANISHELRTPLNAILGLSLYLIEKEENSEKKKTLETLNKAGQGLLEMVNDILDLSKIEADKIIAHNKPNSIDNIISDIIDITQFQSKSKNIQIQYKKTEFHHLNIDKKYINKIIMNILSNAIKFTEDGGKIDIDVKYENSTPTTTDLIMVFTDNGRGIEEKDLERIFNPFEQLYDKDREYGTGLGLFITKKIIEDMNGNISIKSKVGIGTSICIKLKDIEIIKSKLIDQYHTMRRNVTKFKDSKTIAIIDDIEFNREVLKKKVEDYGFEIIEAINGQDMLNKLDSISKLPDIIFTDIKMPIMDGIELTKRIKSSDRTKSIPVIAITAHGMVHEELEIKKHCDGYLAKPIENKELDSIITTIFK